MPAIDGDADTMCAEQTSVLVVEGTTGHGSEVTVDAGGGYVTREPEVAGPTVGQRIGEFTLERRLGEGGMGVVFAAWSHKLARRVALKVPTRTLDEEVRARIVREAQSLAGVAHPNVVQIYEIGEEDGVVFIAMELVEGVTLKRWQTDAPRGWRELVPMYMQAGRGLAAAHARGLVHRDFKPSNTLVDREGAVRLIDFGLARRRDSSRDVAPTVEGDEPSGPEFVLSRRCGTPRYMAPELYETGGTVDARSDQYSFCVALWEALLGELPDPKRSAPRDARAPAWLLRALRRGLAYRREDRFPTMDALLAELERGVKPPRARLPFAVAALGAALAAGAGARVVVGDAPACADPSELAEALWPASAREAARAAGDAGAAAESWLSGQVSAWASARAALCRGGDALAGPSRVRAEQCLGERQRSLGGLGEALGLGAAEGWEPARWDGQLALWSRALAPIGDCLDPLHLEQTIAAAGVMDMSDATWLEDRLERGGALVRAGAYVAAGPLLEQARERAEALQDPWRRARAELDLAIAAFGRGEEADARRRFEAAAGDAEAAGDDFLAVDAWRWLVFLEASRGAEPGAALTLVPLAVGKLRRIGQAAGPRGVDLELSAAWAELRRGDLDGAHTRLADALLRASGVDEGLAARVLRHHAELAHRHGQHPAAIDLARQALTLQIRREGPESRAVGDTRQSLARYELAAGQLAEAAGDVQAALASAAQRPDPRERATLHLLMATLRYTEGDLAAARVAADRSVAEFAAVSDPLAARADRIALAKLRGDLSLEAGDLAAARRAYEGGLAVAGGDEVPEARDNLIMIQVGLAAADHRAGELAAAEAALAGILGELERRPAAPDVEAFALGTAAEVDRDLGRPVRAEDRCRRALERLPASDPLAPALKDLLAQIRRPV